MYGKSDEVVDKYPLPDTIDGICDLMRQVLSSGNVRRFELDINDIVRVYRESNKSDLEEMATEWDAAIRNVPNMVEYSSPGAEAHQYLVDMMHLVHAEKLHSMCFITGPNESDLLDQWLEFTSRGMPNGEPTQLLGLPLYRVGTLPEETLLLCGSRAKVVDPDDVIFVVKTAIEIRRDHEWSEEGSEADSGVWHSPEERTAAACQLQIDTGELRKIPWRSTYKS